VITSPDSFTGSSLTIKDGDVGIGDTTPDYKLDVAGTLGVDGAATFSSNVTVAGNVETGDKFLFPAGDYLFGDGTNLFYVTADLATTNAVTSN